MSAFLQVSGGAPVIAALESTERTGIHGTRWNPPESTRTWHEE
jgi:hypothetical protein